MRTSLDLHAISNVALNLDRLALATLLLDSVEDPQDEGWEQAWSDELHRRSAAAAARAVRGAPWSEVRARLLRDLAGR